MQQVLWPKYLLGGMLSRGEGMSDAERGEGGESASGEPMLHQIRGLVGRWPDADTLLQGGTSGGLRDWDLWYVLSPKLLISIVKLTGIPHCRGPLLFCLLLSFLLSLNAKGDQRSYVFSGVFATIWIGEAVVTLQIKLLGGHMYVQSFPSTNFPNDKEDFANVK